MQFLCLSSFAVGWVPAENDSEQYVKVDFDAIYDVTAIQLANSSLNISSFRYMLQIV